MRDHCAIAVFDSDYKLMDIVIRKRTHVEPLKIT